MPSIPLQYITDNKGKRIGVGLPIEFWRSIFPHDETDKILSSQKMKKRILEAMKRDDGYSLKGVREKLGIW